MSSKEWFTGSKDGLEKIARRRGLSYVLFELVQNCWDTGAKFVKVNFTPVPGQSFVDVQVEDDDPDGFADLTHSWTLFAESAKKSNPEKRGMFNFGEKLVLAICHRAEIASTKGTVIFDSDGRREMRKKNQRGTIFWGRIKMTRMELEEVRAAARLLICPEGVSTTIDGEPLARRPSDRIFEATLPTMISDEEGVVRQRDRKTEVRVYETLPDMPGQLYEMGIPVCITGDPWDVEIRQKVPVNLERNGVSASYMRAVRVLTANAMVEILTKADTSSLAVREALNDSRCSVEVVHKVLDNEYGHKRAIFDPRDLEANNALVAEGYKIIHGGAFSKDAWENIRASGAVLPSGQIRPTPKPYSTDPDAKERVLLPVEEWTMGMRNTRAFAMIVAERLLGVKISVVIDKGHKSQHWVACYGHRELTFNLATLGRKFFERGPTAELNGILIHEFSHETESNHLSEGFHKALETLGAKMVDLALECPDLFNRKNWSDVR